MIDPTGPGGAVAEVTGSGLGNQPGGIAFDGRGFWTANSTSVSTVIPAMTTPWPVSTVNISAGSSAPVGILFDGSNIWVTDALANTLVKLNGFVVVQTVNVGHLPQYPVYDGANIWVPNSTDNSVSVVRAATGTVIATLTGNGLNGPVQAAFDGQRILVTNLTGNSVSLWKAADLTPITTFSTGAGSGPAGVCSDGLYFWITLNSTGKLARF
jgi:YVTN family beta-propeller protein